MDFYSGAHLNPYLMLLVRQHVLFLLASFFKGAGSSTAAFIAHSYVQDHRRSCFNPMRAYKVS